MIELLLPLAFMQAAPAAEPAPAVALTLDQQAALRCSAVFAIVSAGQDRGDADALAYPALGTRGREFFVRSMARIMDDTGLDREQIGRLAGAQAQELRDRGTISDAMPACLLMLDASGL